MASIENPFGNDWQNQVGEFERRGFVRFASAKATFHSWEDRSSLAEEAAAFRNFVAPKLEEQLSDFLGLPCRIIPMTARSGSFIATFMILVAAAPNVVAGLTSAAGGFGRLSTWIEEFLFASYNGRPLDRVDLTLSYFHRPQRPVNVTPPIPQKVSPAAVQTCALILMVTAALFVALFLTAHQQDQAIEKLGDKVGALEKQLIRLEAEQSGLEKAVEPLRWNGERLQGAGGSAISLARPAQKNTQVGAKQ